MPSWSHLLTFLAAAVVIVAIPGPSVLFTISRALTVGRATAVLTVLGNSTGLSLQVLAVAYGLGPLAERSVLVISVLKYVGAAYLVFLGVQAVRHRRSMTEALARKVAPVSRRRAVRDGLVVGVTNPKTIVVFATVLPTFTEPAAGHLTAQILLLGSVFPLLGLVLDTCWAMAAGTARAWFARSPKRMNAIGGAGGMVMIGLGLSVAVTGRKD